MKKAKKNRPAIGSWALVTGASSGIGFAIATELAKQGYNLVIVSRTLSKLEFAREQLLEYKIEIIAISMDLSVRNAADQLFDYCISNSIVIDILINNAGMFSFNDVQHLPPSSVEQIINIHIVTTTNLCRLFAADMSQRGGGYILNISSFSIWMPCPGISLYSATKCYIHNFSISFSQEVRESGVYVTSVLPAGVTTDLYGLPFSLQSVGLKLGILMSPAKVARKSLRALFRHKRSIVPGWYNRLFIPLLKLMPSCFVNFIRRKTMIYQK